MSKLIACVAALIAPLVVPAVIAFNVVFGAALVLPPVGLLAGIFIDGLYRVPGSSIPYASAFGLLATLIGYGVQHLIKTRIMGA